MTDGGSDTFTRDRLLWQAQVLADRGMTLLALHVALVIDQHLNRQSGEAWPGQARMGEILAASRRGVQNAIEQLVSRGHLRVTQGNNRKGGNRYRPLLASEAGALPHAHADAHDTEDHAHPRSHEMPFHAHHGAHETTPHANDASHETRSHVHGGAILMRTPVRPNSMKELSERESLFPSSVSKPKARPRATKPKTSDAQFDEFWLQVPKAKDKADARRAYDKAITSGTVTHHEIMLGIVRYAAERRGQDEQFTKYPGDLAEQGLLGRCTRTPGRPVPTGRAKPSP